MIPFIGRQQELQRLREAAKKKTASFILIKGRRRIGKSRLIEEFSQEFDRYYSFAGLPPGKKTTKKDQLDEFSRQISKNFNTPLIYYDDWTNALWAVADRVQKDKILLCFDEISWMGTKDRNFLGKIKNFWDQYLNKNPRLIFIICGSSSAWIEKNILSSTGFVGRISFTLTLRELPLSDCDQFWPKNISAYEKFKILSVTGGIPKYLEEINPKKSAEENIKNLCFTDGGILVEEFKQIFSDIFLRDSAMYPKIIRALSTGPKEQGEIQELLMLKTPGRLAEYLWELELSGFIARDYSWDIKNGIDSKLSKYRLQDNYLRFYLKYIEKNLTKIERNTFTLKSLTALPEWHPMLGLQFENLVLNNRKKIHQLLGIKPEEIICENPYFQRPTQHQKGCQIDYMVQTKFDTLYICEVKFSKHAIDTAVINEIQAKIDALHRPKRFSCRPILIHVNGVTEDLIEANYFAELIDFGQLLM